MRELGLRSGISKSRIAQIESDDGANATLTLLLALQAAFNLDTLEALLGDPPSAGLADVRAGARR